MNYQKLVRDLNLQIFLFLIVLTLFFFFRFDSKLLNESIDLDIVWSEWILYVWKSDNDYFIFVYYTRFKLSWYLYGSTQPLNIYPNKKILINIIISRNKIYDLNGIYLNGKLNDKRNILTFFFPDRGWCMKPLVFLIWAYPIFEEFQSLLNPTLKLDIISVIFLVLKSTTHSDSFFNS